MKNVKDWIVWPTNQLTFYLVVTSLWAIPLGGGGEGIGGSKEGSDPVSLPRCLFPGIFYSTGQIFSMVVSSFVVPGLH
jgi:hypothetical protein